MTKNFSHIPVLLDEVIEALEITQGKKYIDATIGGGGHTKEILQRGGLVLGIDQDEDALEFVNKDQKENIEEKKIKLANGNFSHIREIARHNGFEKVDGILMDLGVSSYQLDTSERGFSIRHDEKLDMRMDANGQINAYDVVNKYAFDRLVEIFYRYGEEHNAKKIAEAIIDRRKSSPISTTRQLAELVERIPHKNESIHPATRIFQAIRIEVNNELGVLKQALEEGIELLQDEGRFVIISFHSLEDRIVKQTFERWERQKKGMVITKKPLIATFEEQQKNRRSRSAKLRVFETIDN